MALRIDSDFVVAGGKRDKLSPNFSYGEFQAVGGASNPRIHLDLVSGLQALRGRFAKSIRIRGTGVSGAPADAVEGLFVWISGSPLADLEPTLVHPALERTIGELLGALPRSERSGVRRVRA